MITITKKDAQSLKSGCLSRLLRAAAPRRPFASAPAVCETGALAMVLHFLIRGRVQGVGFRWFVHREAAELGLLGWVRNTDDGHVELVASGPPEDLAELRTALHAGSRGSRVDSVLEHELAASEAANLKPFEIHGAW